MSLRQMLTGGLCAILLLSGTAYARAEDKTQERLEDLDFLIETLDAKHPDFYKKFSKEEVQEKKSEIESKLDVLSDFNFAIELSELTAMGGDSHTSISVGQAFLEQAHFIPMLAEWYGGCWTLTVAPVKYKACIGQEVVSINGHTMDEIEEGLSAMVSHDNETYLRRSVGNMAYCTDILAHYGFADLDAGSVPVTVRSSDGKETTLDLPNLTRSEFEALGKSGLANRTEMRVSVPATEPADAYYKMFPLSDDALYVQYNRCMEASDLPMSEFAKLVNSELGTGKYAKLLIDLRNNGGGSDGVLYPLVYEVQQFIAKGGAAYVLAGERTFSSALINTVQLKDVGAAFIGEATGGSVDHFGSVTQFTLPNSRISGQYSNKFIDLGTYYDAAKKYGVESFIPDIEVKQTFEDYLEGTDTAVQYILDNEPVKPENTVTAFPSPSRIIIDGKPVSASAYLIGGYNYYKLRDLAMAFKDTKAEFNVEWDAKGNSVTISESAYIPDGSEFIKLQKGGRNGTRAIADMQIKLPEGGLYPFVGRAYEIENSHYLKLRDLCAVLSVSVNWDAKTKNVSIDTTKPYFS